MTILNRIKNVPKAQFILRRNGVEFFQRKLYIVYYYYYAQYSELYVSRATYKLDTSQKTDRASSGEFSLENARAFAESGAKLFFFLFTNKLYKNSNQVLVD